MEGFSFSTNIRVRFAETDAQGIAHNSSYFVWFEVARVDYLERVRRRLPAAARRGSRGARPGVARALHPAGGVRRPAARPRALPSTSGARDSATSTRSSATERRSPTAGRRTRPSTRRRCGRRGSRRGSSRRSLRRGAVVVAPRDGAGRSARRRRPARGGRAVVAGRSSSPVVVVGSCRRSVLASGARLLRPDPDDLRLGAVARVPRRVESSLPSPCRRAGARTSPARARRTPRRRCRRSERFGSSIFWTGGGADLAERRRLGLDPAVDGVP